VAGDISDLETVERALDEHEITNVIHLAALQVPFCRADPPLGARVNVLGTVNVFEAVRRRLERMAPIVYASSIAAFDAPDDAPEPSMTGHPGRSTACASARTKATRRSTTPRAACRARVPAPAYRVRRGRTRALPLAPTTAMLSAAAGCVHDPTMAAQLSPAGVDVARAFMRHRFPAPGDATVHNPPEASVSIPKSSRPSPRATPRGASIGFEDLRLPFPEDTDAGRSPTSCPAHDDAASTACAPRSSASALRRQPDLTPMT
jgi:hypothetical protein